MRAFVLRDFDKVPMLDSVPTPEPGDGEVRVRLVASSVNPADWMTATGGFRAMSEYRLPAVVGRDVAGVVDQVGPEVTALEVGDEVFGFVKRDYVGDGTFAEHVVVPQDRFVIRKPADLAFVEAGCLGLAGVTALQCLDAVTCTAGETLLVNGASGGVGAFLVQVAARRGVRVLATARPGDEADHVRDLGAAETVDWSGAGTAAAVLAHAPDGVHGIVDLVARSSAELTGLAERVLLPGRTSVSTLSAAPRSTDPVNTVPGQALVYVNVHSSGDVALLDRLLDEVASGLRVPVVATYDLEEIGEAFAHLARGPLGKVGLTFGPGDGCGNGMS